MVELEALGAFHGGMMPMAGGDEIVIIGRTSYYTHTPYTLTPAPGGAGGTSDPFNQAYLQWTSGYYQAQAHDVRIDNAASNAAKDILNLGDILKTREASVFLYEDAGGTVHESQIILGTSTSASPSGSFQLQDYGIPADATLVGYIHSHPLYGADGSTINTNRGYADNGDMFFVENAGSMAQSGGNIKVDTLDFRGYVLHDRTMDEYDLTSHQQYTSEYQGGDPHGLATHATADGSIVF